MVDASCACYTISVATDGWGENEEKRRYHTVDASCSCYTIDRYQVSPTGKLIHTALLIDYQVFIT